jgi:hypothetical protein
MDPTMKKFIFAILIYLTLLNYKIHINYIFDLINFNYINLNIYVIKKILEFLDHNYNEIILYIILLFFPIEIFYMIKLKSTFILSQNFKNISLHLFAICIWLDLFIIIEVFNFINRIFFGFKIISEFFTNYDNLEIKTLPLFYAFFVLFMIKRNKKINDFQ